jgi:hypothetical protein
MSCNGHASTEPRGPKAGHEACFTLGDRGASLGSLGSVHQKVERPRRDLPAGGEREKIGGDFVCACAPSPRTPPFNRNTEYRSLRSSSPGPCREGRKVRAIRQPQAPTARGFRQRWCEHYLAFSGLIAIIDSSKVVRLDTAAGLAFAHACLFRGWPCWASVTPAFTFLVYVRGVRPSGSSRLNLRRARGCPPSAKEEEDGD